MNDYLLIEKIGFMLSIITLIGLLLSDLIHWFLKNILGFIISQKGVNYDYWENNGN